MSVQIDIPKDEIAAFCQRNRIRRMALFGSVLRTDFGPESDVDVLVEFEPGKTPGFHFVTVEDELGDIVGRPVDMHTFDDVRRSRNWMRRESILGSAEVIYELQRPNLPVGYAHSGREAVELFGSMTSKDLEADRIQELAAIRAVEVIGEAASGVSKEVREQYHEIQWYPIIGTRNRLAHDYKNTNLETLARIIGEELPPLIEQLQAIVEEGPSDATPHPNVR